MAGNKRVGARAGMTARWLVPREKREAVMEGAETNRAQRRANGRRKRKAVSGARRGWR